MFVVERKRKERELIYLLFFDSLCVAIKKKFQHTDLR